jgi:hypothetical protein
MKTSSSIFWQYYIVFNDSNLYFQINSLHNAIP